VLAKAREQLQCQKSAPSESGKKMIRTFGRRRWAELDHLNDNALALYERLRDRTPARRRNIEVEPGNHASGHRHHDVLEEWQDARSDRRDG
jgi:hypothetical protein